MLVNKKVYSNEYNFEYLLLFFNYLIFLLIVEDEDGYFS